MIQVKSQNIKIYHISPSSSISPFKHSGRVNTTNITASELAKLELRALLGRTFLTKHEVSEYPNPKPAKLSASSHNQTSHAPYIMDTLSIGSSWTVKSRWRSTRI